MTPWTMCISNRLHNDKHIVTSTLKVAEGAKAVEICDQVYSTNQETQSTSTVMGSHSKSKQAVCGNIHMRSQAHSSWRKKN